MDFTVNLAGNVDWEKLGAGASAEEDHFFGLVEGFGRIGSRDGVEFIEIDAGGVGASVPRDGVCSGGSGAVEDCRNVPAEKVKDFQCGKARAGKLEFYFGGGVEGVGIVLEEGIGRGN